jgi:hypothetical protein
MSKYTGNNIEKSKKYFLTTIKYFHDNYTPFIPDIEIYRQISGIDQKISAKDIAMKDGILRGYSQLNYHKLEQLVLQKENCFETLYDLEKQDIKKLFEALNRTSLLLKYYTTYHFDENRTYREREELKKHYDIVIDDIKAHANKTEKTALCLEILNNRKNILTEWGQQDTSTLTERKIFENLLFELFNLLRKGGQSLKKIPISIAKHTSSIITEFFDKDIAFGKDILLKRFKEYQYTFEINTPIVLFHTP